MNWYACSGTTASPSSGRRENGSIRYYGKEGHPRLIRLDDHGSREVPQGTCRAILKAADIDKY